MTGTSPTRTSPTSSGTGAAATGATATGAASLGAMALGAMALGALAVGALAVGRLTVGRARLRRVEIGELTVGRLAIGADGAGALSALARIRAAPGRGDALERYLLQPDARNEPGTLLYRARRARHDPDLFLFHESYADEAAFERHAEVPHLEARLRQAAEQGLVAAPDADVPLVELYRTL